MTIEAVVFDLDGTLIDSRGDIVAACLHMLQALGLPPLEEERIASFVGDGARLLVARALGLPSDAPDVDPALEIFLREYEAHPVERTVWMSGAVDIFERLAPLPVGLCTNKPRRTTEPVLRSLGVWEKFAAIVAGGDTPEHKPHPAPVLLAAELLGKSPEVIAFVGDGPQDIEAGRAASMLTVGVRGGILAEELLVAARPDVLLDSLEQLPSWLQEQGHAALRG